MIYKNRVILHTLIHSLIVFLGFIFALFTCGYTLQEFEVGSFIILSLVLILSYNLFAFSQKLYYKDWENTSVDELVTIIKVTTFSVLVTFGVAVVLNRNIEIRILIEIWMTLILFVSGPRFAFRIMND